MFSTRSKTAAAVLCSAAIAVSASACGSSSSKPSAAAAASTSTSAAASSGTTSVPASSSGGTSMSADSSSTPFGSACAAVPSTGAGSFTGMATAPVATAASANPVLSTLVTAVKAAGLVDTLNSAQGITVFAPTNDAFNKIPADTLKAVLADKTKLTKILTYHVVSGRLSPDQLAGTHATLEGGTVNVTGSGQSFQVNGANVVCGNVQTANATVYIVDTVLMPAS
ncbi:fasciclin domain-containing protein [Catenulispora sp. NF23]|uniref:Fasciclin domain-containing protein n=1 Tax=Catenulispora pinistramenti TaxID=2705254 RepID=A0ABS5KYY3_9ACTN|nr:fasciclin domain-containing protein [Catenulispora pinistramenti]MBS2534709.1 fasciclin domain-containing protein [Catenulispora pinistramenti]MBS2551130.1 fasciclin domain-containing protein [Catenulispora pinistramenti]